MAIDRHRLHTALTARFGFARDLLLGPESTSRESMLATLLLPLLLCAALLVLAWAGSCDESLPLFARYGKSTAAMKMASMTSAGKTRNAPSSPVCEPRRDSETLLLDGAELDLGGACMEATAACTSDAWTDERRRPLL